MPVQRDIVCADRRIAIRAGKYKGFTTKTFQKVLLNKKYFETKFFEGNNKLNTF